MHMVLHNVTPYIIFTRVVSKIDYCWSVLVRPDHGHPQFRPRTRVTPLSLRRSLAAGPRGADPVPRLCCDVGLPLFELSSCLAQSVRRGQLKQDESRRRLCSSASTTTVPTRRWSTLRTPRDASRSPSLGIAELLHHWIYLPPWPEDIL